MNSLFEFPKLQILAKSKKIKLCFCFCFFLIRLLGVINFKQFFMGEHRWVLYTNSWANTNTPLFHSFALHIGKHPLLYPIMGTQSTKSVRKGHWLVEPLCVKGGTCWLPSFCHHKKKHSYIKYFHYVRNLFVLVHTERNVIDMFHF